MRDIDDSESLSAQLAASGRNSLSLSPAGKRGGRLVLNQNLDLRAARGNLDQLALAHGTDGPPESTGAKSAPESLEHRADAGSHGASRQQP